MAEKGFALIKGRTYKGELKKRLVELVAEYDKVYWNGCLTVFCSHYCDGCATQKKMGKLAVQIELLKEKIYRRK